MFDLSKRRQFTEATVKKILDKFNIEEYDCVLDDLYRWSGSLDLDIQRKLINIDYDLSEYIDKFNYTTIEAVFNEYDVIEDNMDNEEIIYFGKYRGRTIKSVIEVNAGWVTWAYDNVEHFRDFIDKK